MILDSLTSLTKKKMMILESLTSLTKKMNRKSFLMTSLMKKLNWMTLLMTLSTMRLLRVSLPRNTIAKKKILGELVPSFWDAF